MTDRVQIPEFRQECMATRWVAYFDLLGTRNLVSSGGILRVFGAYQRALERLAKEDAINYAWFSDSFLLYTSDDSGSSFTDIERVCRWFVFLLVLGRIPVRGALACGTLYADESARVYIGPALVEAYEWGENQEWIGFLLTPTTVVRLIDLGLPIEERLNYRRYLVPFKKPLPVPSDDYAACVLGNWNRLMPDRRNQLVDVLQKMLDRQREERVRRKYENTLEFLRKHEPSAAAPE